jgi:hypothetical protein
LAITTIPGKLAQSVLGANPVNYASDTIKVTLHSSAYTPDQDAHQFFSSVTNELATGNGYTSGGFTLISKVVSYDAANNKNIFDAGDAAWTAAGGTIGPFRYACVRKDTGSAATSPILAIVDFGANQSITDGNTSTIIWDGTNGVFTGGAV